MGKESNARLLGKLANPGNVERKVAVAIYRHPAIAHSAQLLGKQLDQLPLPRRARVSIAILAALRVHRYVSEKTPQQ